MRDEGGAHKTYYLTRYTPPPTSIWHERLAFGCLIFDIVLLRLLAKDFQDAVIKASIAPAGVFCLLPGDEVRPFPIKVDRFLSEHVTLLVQIGQESFLLFQRLAHQFFRKLVLLQVLQLDALLLYAVQQVIG